jgi:hypothetical protein
MKRISITVLVLLGIGLAARQAVRKVGTLDCGKFLDKMPDDAPPKWMFRNITEIHDNTERIIELLETQASNQTSAESVATFR